MEIKKVIKREKKQIIFNVNIEDHEEIKVEAARRGISMRVFIINAIASAITSVD